MDRYKCESAGYISADSQLAEFVGRNTQKTIYAKLIKIIRIYANTIPGTFLKLASIQSFIRTNEAGKIIYASSLACGIAHIVKSFRKHSNSYYVEV